jgi:hypothetical protein
MLVSMELITMQQVGHGLLLYYRALQWVGDMLEVILAEYKLILPAYEYGVAGPFWYVETSSRRSYDR